MKYLQQTLLKELKIVQIYKLLIYKLTYEIKIKIKAINKYE